METKKVINDSIHVSELKEHIEQGLVSIKRSGAGICLIFRSEKEDVYTEKELISFGNFILSDERDKHISSRENLQRVHHADLENWKQSL